MPPHEVVFDCPCPALRKSEIKGIAALGVRVTANQEIQARETIVPQSGREAMRQVIMLEEAYLLRATSMATASTI